MYFQIFSQSIGLSTLGGVRGEEDPGRSATEPCAFPAGEGGESENPGSWVMGVPIQVMDERDLGLKPMVIWDTSDETLIWERVQIQAGSVHVS